MILYLMQRKGKTKKWTVLLISPKENKAMDSSVGDMLVKTINRKFLNDQGSTHRCVNSTICPENTVSMHA